MAVSRSAASQARRTDGRKPSRRPRMRMRTCFSTKCDNSCRKPRSSKSIRHPTSSSERFQFSVENAKTDRTSMPLSKHASPIFLRLSYPARCPCKVGRPRSLAHRRLPSMMIAKCLSGGVGIRLDKKSGRKLCVNYAKQSNRRQKSGQHNCRGESRLAPTNRTPEEVAQVRTERQEGAADGETQKSAGRSRKPDVARERESDRDHL